MLQIFKDLLDTLADPAPESTETRDRALQLATAVLLVEVMRVDPQGQRRAPGRGGDAARTIHAAGG